MTRRGVIAMLVVGGTALVAGCGGLFPARYRFRMTVEVDTPQGLRTGSSVLEVTSRLQNLPGRGVTPITTLTGEAVAVDLPGRRTLFVLLQEGLATDVTLAFEPTSRRQPEEFVASVERLGGTAQRGRTVELSSSSYPRFVTFRDKHDPKSVEIVNPSNVAASFGSGVVLRRIGVMITNDNRTTGIDKRFSWWPDYENKQLDGHRYNDSTDFANSLNRRSFRQEKR